MGTRHNTTYNIIIMGCGASAIDCPCASPVLRSTKQLRAISKTAQCISGGSPPTIVRAPPAIVTAPPPAIVKEAPRPAIVTAPKTYERPRRRSPSPRPPTSPPTPYSPWRHSPSPSPRGYGCSGGCFGPDAQVIICDEDKSKKRLRVSEVKPGDKLLTNWRTGEFSTVLVVYKIERPVDRPLVAFDGGLQITGGHPVRIDGEWRLPREVSNKRVDHNGIVYNFLMEDELCEAIIVDGQECIISWDDWKERTRASTQLENFNKGDYVRIEVDGKTEYGNVIEVNEATRKIKVENEIYGKVHEMQFAKVEKASLHATLSAPAM